MCPVADVEVMTMNPRYDWKSVPPFSVRLRSLWRTPRHASAPAKAAHGAMVCRAPSPRRFVRPRPWSMAIASTVTATPRAHSSNREALQICRTSSCSLPWFRHDPSHLQMACGSRPVFGVRSVVACRNAPYPLRVPRSDGKHAVQSDAAWRQNRCHCSVELTGRSRTVLAELRRISVSMGRDGERRAP
jgi:hypothetical protein